MSGKPVITIITPVYNGEKYISETIESVINARLSFPMNILSLMMAQQTQPLEFYKNTRVRLSFFIMKT